MPSTRRSTARFAVLAAGLSIAGVCAPATAQSLSERAREIAREQQARRMSPTQENAIRLMRTMTVEFENQTVKTVVDFIARTTGAEIEPLYISDRYSDGLDPDQLVNFRVRNASALTAIEILLDEATPEFDSSGGNSWQFDRGGALEIGPKSRLNRRKRVEVYPILDLLLELPTYDNAPEFDLNQILQSSRGGGGQSPFRDTGDDDVERIPLEDRVGELTDIIRSLVEPEQWSDNGGDGASMRYWQGSLIIEAPDYVHRALGGYSWWPRNLVTTRISEAPADRPRRWVSLSIDPQFAEIVGFENQEISAVVNGQIVNSGDD